MTIDIVSIEKLLIKEHYDLFFSLAYYCASESKWNEFSSLRIDIDNSVSDAELTDILSWEGLEPKGKVLYT